MESMDPPFFLTRKDTIQALPSNARIRIWAPKRCTPGPRRYNRPTTAAVPPGVTKSMTLAIESYQLTRYFGSFCAVQGIDLRVEGGTFYGFLGPNGAGKSTTIKMLTGLLAPTDGKIVVLGRNMLDARESLQAKARMGVIPEDLALFDNLTA